MIIQVASLPKPFAPPKPSPSHLPDIPNSGLLFRRKILYLTTHLKINPQKALQLNPNLRSCPLSSLQSVENCLVSMGIPRSSFPRIFDMLPHLLTSDPYSDLYPVFDFLLHDVSIPYHDIRKSINRCPRLLLTDVDDQLRPTLLFLKKLGFRITWQNTVLLVSSVENTLGPKIEYLIKSSGFSYEDVVRMVLRSPSLLTYSIENNLRPKMEYFVEEMRGDLIELKRFPQYFSFSLEGRIMPRHRVLIDRGIMLPLADMLKISDGEFNTRLIEMRLDMAENLKPFET